MQERIWCILNAWINSQIAKEKRLAQGTGSSTVIPRQGTKRSMKLLRMRSFCLSRIKEENCGADFSLVRMVTGGEKRRADQKNGKGKGNDLLLYSNPLMKKFFSLLHKAMGLTEDSEAEEKDPPSDDSSGNNAQKDKGEDTSLKQSDGFHEDSS